MEDNKALVRHWLNLWNEHALDKLDALVAADYVHHGSSGNNLNFDGFQKGFGTILRAFPEIHYIIVHLIAEGDQVAASLSSTATQQGAFFGIAPTGSHTTFRGVYHCRILNGKIVEDWDVFDLLNPLLRLGATIEPTSTQ